MVALGAADSGGTAAARARAKLGGVGGGGSFAATATPYQIPIRTGQYSYLRPENRGQFDDDLSTGVRGKRRQDDVDLVERFNLTDEGVNAAMGTWYGFEDGERATLAKRMWYLGLLKDPRDFDGAYKVWKSAVEHAGRFALKGREMDPRDVLEMMGDASGGAAGPLGNGTRARPGPSVTRQIDFTDPETAKAWIQSAFQQSMGREAEDAEVRALADALKQQERANPRITTVTPTKFDDEGRVIDSTTETTGGFSSDAFIQNRVNADPEATAHQAAGELYPALMQALGASL